MAREIRGAYDRGVKASDPEMLVLAKNWRGLFDKLTGGDHDLVQSMRAPHAGEPGLASGFFRGVLDDDVMRFLAQAVQHMRKAGGGA